MKAFYIFILLIISLCIVSQAQDLHHDSVHVDSAKIIFIYNDPVSNLINDSIHYDYSLSNFQRFDPLNKLSFYNSNGVLGGLFQASYFPDRINFNSFEFFKFFNEQNIYNFNSSNLKLFYNNTAFTEVSYSSGYSREQYFDLVHAQPLTKQWSLSLEYRLISAPGAYKNQQSKHSHFRSIVHYIGKEKLYHAYIGFSQNNILRKENGGITDQNTFIDTLIYDRQLVPINLYSAEHKYRKSEYFLSHGININYKKESEKHIFLKHKMFFNHKYNVFADSDPYNSFYNQILIDTISTADSLRHQCLQNSIIIGNRNSSILRWFGEASYMQHKIFNTVNDTSFSEIALKAAFALHLIPGFTLSTNSKISLIESSHTDLYINASLFANDSLKFKPFINLSYLRITPSVFFQKYYGNHINWEYSPEQMSNIYFEGGLEFKKQRLSFFNSNVNKLMYFTESSIEQGGNGMVSGILYQGKFDFGRFSLNLKGTYQNERNAHYISIPEWIAFARISMHNKVFNKALSLHSGIEISSFANYYADAYDPIRQVFYRQESIKTGGYIYPGIFIEAQIKRMRVFVESQNIIAGLLPVNYWQIPGYPLPDRAIRFGLSWIFFN